MIPVCGVNSVNLGMKRVKSVCYEPRTMAYMIAGKSVCVCVCVRSLQKIKYGLPSVNKQACKKGEQKQKQNMKWKKGSPNEININNSRFTRSLVLFFSSSPLWHSFLGHQFEYSKWKMNTHSIIILGDTKQLKEIKTKEGTNQLKWKN